MHIKKVDKIVLLPVTLELFPVLRAYLFTHSSPIPLEVDPLPNSATESGERKRPSSYTVTLLMIKMSSDVKVVLWPPKASR